MTDNEKHRLYFEKTATEQDISTWTKRLEYFKHKTEPGSLEMCQRSLDKHRRRLAEINMALVGL